MYKSPAHITGFFYPVISQNPLQSGSLGAGFSLKIYSYTSVKKEKRVTKVFMNGIDRTEEACTSKKAIDLFFKEAGFKENVVVSHSFEFPVGCGLASSGAGALGVVFSLNEMFDTDFSRLKLAQLAHIAEVECRTGLGSVVGQYDGMFEIRIKAGAPGIGEVIRFKLEYPIGIIVLGPLETKKVLSTSKTVDMIKKAFGEKHYSLRKKFSFDNFISFSLKFMEETNIATDSVIKILKIAQGMGLKGSMLMLGEGVFLTGDKIENKFSELVSKIKKFAKPIYTKITYIDNYGTKRM